MVSTARALRKRQTIPEILLWDRLKNRQVAGLKFRRQVPFGRYILDFYCKEKSLGIEIDGESHIGKEAYDEEREAFLQACDINVIRFTNRDILEDLDETLTKIRIHF